MPDSPDADSHFETACPEIDDALGGGFERGRTVQLYGPSSAGKTNIAATVAASAVADGNTVMFLAEGKPTFGRVNELIDHRADDPDFARGNLLVRSLQTFYEQNEVIKSKVKEMASSVDVIIIDGAGRHYRLERAQGDRPVDEVEKLFTRQITLLRTLARRHDIAVLVTNQVYSDPEEDVVKPLGAAGLQNWFDAVLRVNGFRNGKHVMFVEKHRDAPEGVREWFTIEEDGIASAPDK